MSGWATGLIIAGTLIGSLVIGLITLRIVVFEPFTVPSATMAPAIGVGDTVVVNKLSYDFRPVHRGDIVVFRTPPAEDCGGPRVSDLIKRVIGLPGDTLVLTSGSKGFVFVDGKRLAEPWLASTEQGTTYPGPSNAPYSLTKPYRVPPNEYFVLGDRRTDSCDSRFWGPISKSLIVGSVEFTYHP
jgi:signal peptidase I